MMRQIRSRFDPICFVLKCADQFELQRDQRVLLSLLLLPWNERRSASALPVLSASALLFSANFFSILFMFVPLEKVTLHLPDFSFLRGYISMMAASLEESLTDKP